MSSTGSGGRERDKHRQYHSGAAKCKAKEERDARERQALAKVPKISTLFFAKSGAGTGNETGDTDSNVDVLAVVQPQQGSEGASPESGESSTTATSIPTTKADSTHESPELTATSPYSCDLGLWPADVSDRMREYWAVKGSGDCNNSDADFSATSTRFEGEKYNRQCQKSLFTYTHQLTK